MPNSPRRRGFSSAEILQARQVALEIGLAVKVDIECHEVRILRQQVFGGWIACVREESVFIFLASDVDEVFNEFGYLPRT